MRAWQAQGTKKVNIYYDLTTDTPAVGVSVLISGDGGTTWNVPAQTLSGDGYPNAVKPGMGKWIVWNAGVDWNGQVSKNVRFRVNVTDSAVPPAPDGFALIPAGSFQMGDALDGYEVPVHTVQVSAFYMAKYLVTKALWDEVRTWGLTHGYTDLAVGSMYGTTNYSKGPTHPVHTITWYDMVKWCDARSEKEGLTPCYTVSGVVYRTGSSDSVMCNWAANGYRLPSEAEWEKAARGGLVGMNFPWGNTITHSQANYYSSSYYSYDVSPTRGYHPVWGTGAYPYTSPVGSFAPNGYGLYDMAGNAWEWCWDWYGSYASGSQTDPRGPSSGSYRVRRGGYWYYGANNCRVALRDSYYPGGSYYAVGFRLARSSVP